MCFFFYGENYLAFFCCRFLVNFLFSILALRGRAFPLDRKSYIVGVSVIVLWTVESNDQDWIVEAETFIKRYKRCITESIGMIARQWFNGVVYIQRSIKHHFARELNYLWSAGRLDDILSRNIHESSNSRFMSKFHNKLTASPATAVILSKIPRLSKILTKLGTPRDLATIQLPAQQQKVTSRAPSTRTLNSTFSSSHHATAHLSFDNENPEFPGAKPKAPDIEIGRVSVSLFSPIPGISRTIDH